MKWGKKKPPSPSSSSSSRPFLISHVLPTSWTTKFKQMSINSGPKPAKVKQKGKCNSVCATTTTTNFFNGGGKFYGGEGDEFWRLSFGDDSVDGFKNGGVIRSVRFDSDDDLEFPPSKANGNAVSQKLNNKISRVRINRGLQEQVESSPQMRSCVREVAAEIRTPRLTVEREKILRKSVEKRLEFEEAEGFPRKNVARKGGIPERVDCKLAAFDLRKETDADSLSYRRKMEKDRVFAAENENYGFSDENFSSEWQKLKEQKIEEFKARNERQRKSVYISRELQRKRTRQNSKLRVNSPRTSGAETCKIKALEDMKAAKMKTKKKAKEKTSIEGFNGLESFAVVKCSYDPQKDFRDSMIEMIKEQRISRPEELEELLACYLTLNSDNYHDLIITVFREVWFELNQACFDTELENEECNY